MVAGLWVGGAGDRGHGGRGGRAHVVAGGAHRGGGRASTVEGGSEVLWTVGGSSILWFRESYGQKKMVFVLYFMANLCLQLKNKMATPGFVCSVSCVLLPMDEDTNVGHRASESGVLASLP